MRPSRRWVLGGALGLAATAWAGGSSAPAPRSGLPRAAQTGALRVSTDASPRYLRVATALIEQFLTRIGDRLGWRAPAALDVALVDDPAAYARLARIHGLDPGGYGAWMGDRRLLLARRRFPDGAVAGFGTVYHEAAHALSDAQGLPVPAFVEEAFGACFEQGRLVDGQWRAGAGRPRRDAALVAALDAGALGPLRRRVAIPDALFRASDEQQHYAEARSVSAWLWSRSPASVGAWVAAVRRGLGPWPALIEASGLDEAQVEPTWRAFVDAVGRPAAALHVAGDDPTALAAIVAAAPTSVEARQRLAAALNRAGRPAEAIAHATFAAQDAGNPFPHLAWRSLALARWDTGDLAGAVAALNQAVSRQDELEEVLVADWRDLATGARALGDAAAAADAEARLAALLADDAS